MGGGPDKEHLLIVLWDPEPKHITDSIRSRWPHIEITYFQLNGPISFKDVGDQVPPGQLIPLVPAAEPSICMHDLCIVRLTRIQNCFAQRRC